ncbi:hypothetical protein A2U01_0099490, partial [Trifolium medium]|nr:hypothetical protein [Trifolium medium]
VVRCVWIHEASAARRSAEPCEQEALTQEEVEREGAIATSLATKINRMRRIAEDLLASGELPEGSRARRDVQEIWE